MNLVCFYDTNEQSLGDHEFPMNLQLAKGMKFQFNEKSYTVVEWSFVIGYHPEKSEGLHVVLEPQ